MSIHETPTLFIAATFGIPTMTDAIRTGLIDTQTAVSQETGCLLYSFSVDLLNPNLIRLIEHWRDRSAFDRHVTRPQSGEFLTWLKTVGGSDFTLQQHDVLRSAAPIIIGN